MTIMTKEQVLRDCLNRMDEACCTAVIALGLPNDVEIVHITRYSIYVTERSFLRMFQGRQVHKLNGQWRAFWKGIECMAYHISDEAISQNMEEAPDETPALDDVHD